MLLKMTSKRSFWDFLYVLRLIKRNFLAFDCVPTILNQKNTEGLKISKMASLRSPNDLWPQIRGQTFKSTNLLWCMSKYRFLLGQEVQNTSFLKIYLSEFLKWPLTSVRRSKTQMSKYRSFGSRSLIMTTFLQNYLSDV